MLLKDHNIDVFSSEPDQQKRLKKWLRENPYFTTCDGKF